MSAVMDQWYYMRGGERVGPMTQRELCALFEGRALGLETLVWGEAFKSWVPASTIAGFRALWGLDGGEPGTGGVLEVEDEGREPLDIAGWLIIPAIGRVIVPAADLLVGALYWFGGWGVQRKASAWSASVLQGAGIIIALVGVYELWTSMLFFRRKRLAVPALIFGWVVWAFCCMLGASIDDGRRPRGISEEMWWLCRVGPFVLWAGIWVWYFSVSRRVKATFVR